MSSDPDILDNLVNPDVFTKRLIDIKLDVKSTLDTLENTYTLHKAYPENIPYLNDYNNSKENANKISARLEILNDTIVKNAQHLRDDYSSKNDIIKSIKNKNTELKKQISIINNSYDGSHKMFDNFKETYNLNYLKNFSMFIGILLASTFCIRMIAKKNEMY